MVKKYQLMVCGSVNGNHIDELIKRIEKGFNDLKLNPQIALQVLKSSDIDKIDINDLLVAVWFGYGSSYLSEDESCIEWLVENRFIVIPIELKKNGHTVSWTFPIVGIPMAESIHKTETLHKDTESVVYDCLGLESLSKEHLTWLNSQLRIKSIKVQEATTWLQTL